MLSDSPETSPRLAVVGGGISGLTAAHRLSQLMPAADVHLFEAGERLGGVLNTLRTEELLIEQGADSFLNKLPHALQLCRELGIDGDLIPTNEQHRRALVWHDGQLLPVPEGFVVIRPKSMWQMMRSPLLSWMGKLRLLAEPWLAVPKDVERDDFDQSVAEFATARLGKEVFERLVQPLLAGIYTADPEKLSLAATMPEAVDALRLHGSLYRAAVKQGQSAETQSSGARYASFVTFRQGLVHLVQKLADGIGDKRIRLNSPVTGVERNGPQQWRLVLPDGSNELYDGIVIALPAPRAGELLASLDATLASELQSIPYASSAVVCFTYEQNQLSTLLEGFGVVVPTVEQRPIIAASFSSMKFPDRAPKGQLLVRVFLGGAVQPEQMLLNDERLIAIAHEQMQQMLGFRAKPLTTNLVRWNEKMPQYHIGHGQVVGRIEAAVAQLPGLELAGNAYHGVGIPQCIRSGEEAARKVIEQLGDEQ